MEKDYLFKVQTLEDFEDLPQGSCIYVKREFKKCYRGEWSFRGATCIVKVPKDICARILEYKQNQLPFRSTPLS